MEKEQAAGFPNSAMGEESKLRSSWQARSSVAHWLWTFVTRPVAKRRTRLQTTVSGKNGQTLVVMRLIEHADDGEYETIVAITPQINPTKRQKMPAGCGELLAEAQALQNPSSTSTPSDGGQLPWTTWHGP